MRQKAVAVREVRNEVLLPQRGDTIYTLALGVDEIRKLAFGRVSTAVAEECYKMLTCERVFDQRWDLHECPTCKLPTASLTETDRPLAIGAMREGKR
jgi:hypothetical protein